MVMLSCLVMLMLVVVVVWHVVCHCMEIEVGK